MKRNILMAIIVLMIFGCLSVAQESYAQEVLNEKDISKISAAQGYTIALKNDGTMWAWGNNAYNQLGDMTALDKSTPVRIALSEKMDQAKLYENIDYQKSSNIRVLLDGTPIEFDVSPQIINGRTLVPMRAIFESLGLTVEWDNLTQAAKGISGYNSIIFTIGSNKAVVNNEEKSIDVPASIIDGRTMIPLRFLSENMGYHVVWVGDSNLVLISKNDIVEWRYGGYEANSYKYYEVKYSNGEKTSETRYTGTYFVPPAPSTPLQTPANTPDKVKLVKLVGGLSNNDPNLYLYVEASGADRIYYSFTDKGFDVNSTPFINPSDAIILIGNTITLVAQNANGLGIYTTYDLTPYLNSAATKMEKAAEHIDIYVAYLESAQTIAKYMLGEASSSQAYAALAQMQESINLLKNVGSACSEKLAAYAQEDYNATVVLLDNPTMENVKAYSDAGNNLREIFNNSYECESYRTNTFYIE